MPVRAWPMCAHTLSQRLDPCGFIYANDWGVCVDAMKCRLCGGRVVRLRRAARCLGGPLRRLVSLQSATEHPLAVPVRVEWTSTAINDTARYDTASLTCTQTLTWNQLGPVYFSGCLCVCVGGGVMDKLGVQDFRSAWLELINVGICGLMNRKP